jgi:hypothetical protein
MLQTYVNGVLKNKARNVSGFVKIFRRLMKTPGGGGEFILKTDSPL